jgi:hypothetical protein
MSGDRISAQVRWTVAVKRGISEYRILTEMTEQAAITRLVQIGLDAEYKRLGIEKDPAYAAAGLLLVLGRSWEDDLSDEELTAFAQARAALGRLTQLRSRDPQ